MARRLPPGPAGDPARLVHSGALGRRVTQLERLLTPASEPAWTSHGMRPDSSPQIHQLLSEARRHAAARRYRKAAYAYEAAERLYKECAESIREARLRRRAEQAGALEAELETLRPLVEHARAVRRGARTASLEAKQNRDDNRRKLMPVITTLHKNRPRAIAAPWRVAQYMRTALEAKARQVQKADAQDDDAELLSRFCLHKHLPKEDRFRCEKPHLPHPKTIHRWLFPQPNGAFPSP